MSTTAAHYQPLLDQITKIASNYSFGTMLNGFNPELINILLRNHLEKLKAASSYTATHKLINDAISSQFGMAMDLTNFITTATDRDQLYKLFAAWRLQLLAEVQV